MQSIIVLTLLLISMSLHAAEVDRPDVIVILVDDKGIDSMSAFNDTMGMKTPAIDPLAREGMSFTGAHSTSSVAVAGGLSCAGQKPNTGATIYYNRHFTATSAFRQSVESESVLSTQVSALFPSVSLWFRE